MNIVFASSSAFAHGALKTLIESHHRIQAVYTQPDRPHGRGLKKQPNVIKQLALEHQLPLYQPQKLDTQAQTQLRSLQADCMVVIAYGLLLPLAVLNTFKLGCVNAHASLLPRWRGASPIQNAILHGDIQTGISWIQMNTHLDQGDILIQYPVDITPSMHSGALSEQLAQTLEQTIIQTLDSLEKKQLTPQRQNHQQASYAPKLQKTDGLIQWNKPAEFIQQQIQALYPWPKAFSFWKKKRVIIHQATAIKGTSTNTTPPGTIQITDSKDIRVQCIEGILLIEKLQLASKSPQSSENFLRGCTMKTGDQLQTNAQHV